MKEGLFGCSFNDAFYSFIAPIRKVISNLSDTGERLLECAITEVIVEENFILKSRVQRT